MISLDVLFACYVDNPNLACKGIQDTYIPCESSGISYAADNTTDGWWGYLQIPFSLIDTLPPVSSPKWAPGDSKRGLTYRGNFFRIDTPKNQTQEFSCWSPTFVKVPCFHMPEYFGFIKLV